MHLLFDHNLHEPQSSGYRGAITVGARNLTCAFRENAIFTCFFNHNLHASQGIGYRGAVIDAARNVVPDVVLVKGLWQRVKEVFVKEEGGPDPAIPLQVRS